MNGLLVLLLTTSVALASPQYNYPQPSGNGGFTGSNHIGGGNNINHGAIGGFGGGSVGGGHNAGFGANNIGGGHSAGHSHDSSAHQTIVTKQFLIHSAPQEQDEVGADKVINLGPARKNYRVVFIKAPHQGVQGGRVKFIAPANEEKTVIYVLSKKTDLADIAADVQQAHSEPAKPEVHFIKYKTVEEAAHAQKTIQAQFDALEGKSQISDEGVAPLTSVVGILGDGGSGHHDAGAQGAGHVAAGSGHLATSGSTGHGAISGAGNNFAAGGNNGGSFGATGAGVGGSYLPPSY